MSRHPVIIGVGDIKNQSPQLRTDGTDEPASLILAAIHAALTDTGLPSTTTTTSPSSPSQTTLLSHIDSLSIVQPWSWPYANLPRHLAARLSLDPSTCGHLHQTPHGGNQPALLLDAASRRISLGQSRAAIICGGDALDSLARYVKAGQLPPPGWTAATPDGLAAFSASALRPPSEKRSLQGVHGIGAPIQVYPLYENATRQARAQSFGENHRESAEMYAQFAAVAATHPVSWGFGKRALGAEEIGQVRRGNRLICAPYPLLMNAFNAVNVAAAALVVDAELAQELGVPRERWVHVLAGAGTSEDPDFWRRPGFTRSEAIERSIDAALGAARNFGGSSSAGEDPTGMTSDEIDLFDFYSCFPIVPKLACRHLGLKTVGDRRPITLLGGLTSFGGAGNNYSMHAIAEMTRRLRGEPARGDSSSSATTTTTSSTSSTSSTNSTQKKPQNGLILANGGVLSYQHVVILSNTLPTPPSPSSPTHKYPSSPPLPSHVPSLDPADFIDFVPATSPSSKETGAVVETYTVDFARSGEPKRGHVVGRLLLGQEALGPRFLANHADEATLRVLASLGPQDEEVVGRKGRVWQVRERVVSGDGGEEEEEAEEGEGKVEWIVRNVFSLVRDEKL